MPGNLTTTELNAAIDSGEIDTVVVAFADAQGRLSGADLCCPGADHLGHLLAWSVQSGATATGLLSMPFYHPTLEEGLKTALRQICRDTRQPEPAGRDFGTPPGA